MTGEYHGRLFTKYLPGYPSVLAVSLALFGTAVPALGIIAGGWVVSTYAAGLQLLGSRRTALLAAGLVALSPIAIVQSALYLSYTLSSALIFTGVATLLMRLSTGRRRWSVVAGVLFGAALLTRTFDVFVAGLPLVLLLAGRFRHEARRLARAVGWSAVGALPLVVLLLAYNAAVTGSPVRMPLPAVEPLDTFGFGLRRIMPGDPLTPYHGRRAVLATAHNLALVPKWSAGGLLLALLAILGAVLVRRRLETLFLLAVVLAFPACYFFFWGSYITSQGIGQVIGPFYYTTAFVPLAMLAAQGLVAIADAVPRRTAIPALAAVAAVAVVLTTLNMKPLQQFHAEKRRNQDRLLALIPPRAQLRTPAVVLVQMPYGSRYVGVSQPYLDNDPRLRNPVLFAASRAAGDNHLPDESGGRALYVLRPSQTSASDVFGARGAGAFAPLSVVGGSRLRVTVEGWTSKPGSCLTGYVNWGREKWRTELTCASRPGQVYRKDLEVGPVGELPLPSPGQDVLLTIGVGERPAGSKSEDLSDARVSLGVRPGAPPRAVALTPGEPWRFLHFPASSAWVNTDVSENIAYQITPG
ncbi:MAG: hypothetical protein QOJ32_141 [Frankiaceae bacterium]|nr:hypothetical protein [Frankiaceae bacterium]